MRPESMYIRLNGLKFFAYHGVLPQENLVGAMYTVNLRLKTNYLKAAQTDDLADTINYAEVFQAVKAEMQIPSKLLEHVAYRIAKHLIDNFPTIESIDISLYKENPPMEAECGNIGVETTYSR